MSRAPSSLRSRRAARGRTLVELMITIAIGLALTAAVTGAYLGSTRTSRTAGELASMADSGQAALMLIGDAIRQAGYGEIIGSDLALGAGDIGAYRAQTLFADGPHLAGCTGARFADPTAANPVCGAAADPNFDTLLVRFQGDAVIPPAQGRIDDCLGLAVPLENLPADHLGASVVAARPMIRNAYFGDAGRLVCQGNGRTGAGVVPPPSPIASDVEQFKVFYAFDDVRYADPASIAAANARSLRDAAWLNALPADTAPWDYVVAVHVCLVVRSPADNRGAATQATQTWRRCPTTAAEAEADLPVATASDGMLRRTYSQVYTVRARSTANPRQFLN
ncbi:MAG TPA: PilW family protein [Burkholderiaceae bacterium]|nr:PilW family protein [Burkholderiaceae bacterium]